MEKLYQLVSLFFLREIGKISNKVPKYQFMGLLYIPKKTNKKIYFTL